MVASDHSHAPTEAVASPQPVYYPAMQVWLSVTHYPDVAAGPRAVETLERHPNPQAHFWLGMMAAADNRWGEVRSQAQRLEAKAGEAVTAGDSTAALRLRATRRALELYAELRRRPDRVEPSDIVALLPELARGADAYAARLLRYEVGQLFLARSQAREARRLFESFQQYELSGEYVVPVEYYRGRVEEELGEVAQARLRYDRVIRWWEGADPELQPWREDARQRLMRLSRER